MVMVMGGGRYLVPGRYGNHGVVAQGAKEAASEGPSREKGEGGKEG